MQRTAQECIEHMVNNIQSDDGRLHVALNFSYQVPTEADALRDLMAETKELRIVLRELLDHDRYCQPRLAVVETEAA